MKEGCVRLKQSQGQHSGALVSTVASQREGPGFGSGSECVCVEFACSPCVCVGSLRVLRLPPTVQKHANWERLITGVKGG